MGSKKILILFLICIVALAVFVVFSTTKKSTVVSPGQFNPSYIPSQVIRSSMKWNNGNWEYACINSQNEDSKFVISAAVGDAVRGIDVVSSTQASAKDKGVQYEDATIHGNKAVIVDVSSLPEIPSAQERLLVWINNDRNLSMFIASEALCAVSKEDLIASAESVDSWFSTYTPTGIKILE